jgi:tetratricopeptide (TPR) repeat protein
VYEPLRAAKLCPKCEAETIGADCSPCSVTRRCRLGLRDEAEDKRRDHENQTESSAKPEVRIHVPPAESLRTISLSCRLQAERLLLEAIEQNANNAWARSVMMGLRRRLQDRLEESVSEWETAIALDPNNTAALLQFGYTLMHLGRPEEAIPIIERGIHLSPYDAGAPGAYQVLGVCHLLLGHIEESIELLRRLGP